MATVNYPPRYVSLDRNLANYPSALILPAGLLIGVDGLVIKCDGVSTVSQLKADTISKLSSGFPSGGVNGSLSIRSGSVFGFVTDLYRDPNSALIVNKGIVPSIYSAGTVSGTYALATIAAHVHGSFATNITIQKPTFSVSGISGQYRVRFRLTNSSSLPKSISFDTGGGQLVLNGWKVPVSSVRPGSSAEFELFTDDAGTTWKIDGWQGGLFEYAAEVEGVATDSQILRETAVPDDLYFPYHETAFALFRCAGTGPTATTTIRLRRYTTATGWQTVATAAIAAGANVSSTLTLNTTNFPTGAIFTSDHTMQIGIDGSANGIQQLRGDFKFFR